MEEIFVMRVPKYRYILVAGFLVIAIALCSTAQTGPLQAVYDLNWQLRYYLKDNTLYDLDWQVQYYVRDDSVFDKKWTKRYYLKDNALYDWDWQRRYYVREFKAPEKPEK